MPPMRLGCMTSRELSREAERNPYDPDSTSNPYGRYGSPFSPDWIHNPFGAGNPYSPSSPTNPYGRGLRIEGR